MHLFFTILFFLFIIQIFRTKGITRFSWFYTSICLISPFTAGGLTTNSHETLCATIIFSFIFRTKKITIKNWRHYPLKYPTIFLLIIHILVIIMRPVNGYFYTFRIGMGWYLTTYILFFIGFASINKLEDITKLTKHLVYIGIICGVYGLFTWITKNNFVTDLYKSIDKLGSIDDRGFRITGFQPSSNVHGIIMLVVFLFINHFNKKINKSFIVIVSLITFLNITLSVTRSIYFDFIIICFSFLTSMEKVTKKVITISVLIILAALVIPVIQHALLKTWTLFTDMLYTGGTNTKGSSIALRKAQWLSSISFFIKSPIWGNGFSYYELIQSNIDKDFTREGLFGMEGYVYWLLVEQGGLMIFGVLIFLTKYLILIIQKIKNNSRIAIITITLFTMTIVHLGINRPIWNFEYLFPILGILLKVLILYKNKQKMVNSKLSYTTFT